MIKKRIGWLDICKGIGIILVILGHVYSDAHPVKIWIYSFHMPLFFFVSGYLKGQFKKKTTFKEKIIALIIPYVELLVVQIAFYFFIERRFHTFTMGPIWFLLALFGVEILNENMLIKERKWLICASVAIFAAIHYLSESVISTFQESLSVWVSILCCGSIFYLLGGIVQSLQGTKFLGVVKNGYCRLIGGVILAVLSTLLAKVNGNVNMYFGKYSNIFIYYLAAISGIMLVIAVGKWLNSNSFLEYMGQNTLLIMGTHRQILLVLLYIASKVLRMDSTILRDKWYMTLLLTISIICVEFILIWILKKLRSASKASGADILLKWVKI